MSAISRADVERLERRTRSMSKHRKRESSTSLHIVLPSSGSLSPPGPHGDEQAREGSKGAWARGRCS
jgi:hypothetical protein